MLPDRKDSNKPRVRAAKAADCFEIARFMREEDRTEIAYNSRSTPLEALQRGLKLSEICKTITFNGTPIAMFGVVRDTEKHWIGIPWMLATPEIGRIRKSFLRRAKDELDKLSFGFRMLSNAVWAGNTIHILWLRWMGFHMEIDKPVVQNGTLFYPFWRDVGDV